MIVRYLAPALIVSVALFTSCRKPVVESYRIPKETAAQTPPAAPESSGRAAGSQPPSAAPNPAAAPAGGSMANTAVATAAGAGLTWTAPAHWTTKAGPAMRKATYSVPGEGGEAELTITAFPGDVGGELANLNRWRSQLQLPPVAQKELESAAQRIERNGLRLTVVDIAGSGASPQRILGAMIPHDGSTWFFKLGPGPDKTVAKEKSAFTAFLDTIKPAAPTGK